MKLLLDESLPQRLKHDFTGHEVSTVADQGWAGLSNGELLRLGSGSFDVFLTADQNLQYQQNLSGFGIAVIVLAAPSNRYQEVEGLVPKILTTLKKAKRGEVTVVSV